MIASRKGAGRWLSAVPLLRHLATALLKLGVACGGAYLTLRLLFCNSNSILPLSVGMVFGVVVAVWHSRAIRNLIELRIAAFLVSSALIWILVYRLVSPFPVSSAVIRILVDVGLMPPPAGYREDLGLIGPVALGTILLVIAHAWFVGASVKRLLTAIPCILGIWYLTFWRLAIPSSPQDAFGRGIGVGIALALSATAWQGAYLLFLFGSIPRFLRNSSPFIGGQVDNDPSASGAGEKLDRGSPVRSSCAGGVH